MRIILFILLYAYQINAICFVSHFVCAQKWVGNTFFIADCDITCNQKEEKKCGSVNLVQPKKDVGSVTIKAAAAKSGPLKGLYLNLSLAETVWETFKVKIHRDEEPSLAICKTYLSKGKVPAPSNFQIKLSAAVDYALYENKEIILEYSINALEKSKYGKMVFRIPYFYRFVRPEDLGDLELFAYIDQSEEEVLRLKIQVPASDHFKIPKIDVEVVKDNIKIVANASLPVSGDHLHYTYNATDKAGDYYFIITPNSTDCGMDGCYKTISPMADLKLKNIVLAYVIGVVGIILCIALCICCCCCKRHHS